MKHLRALTKIVAAVGSLLIMFRKFSVVLMSTSSNYAQKREEGGNFSGH